MESPLIYFNETITEKAFPHIEHLPISLKEESLLAKLFLTFLLELREPPVGGSLEHSIHKLLSLELSHDEFRRSFSSQFSFCEFPGDIFGSRKDLAESILFRLANLGARLHAV